MQYRIQRSKRFIRSLEKLKRSGRHSSAIEALKRVIKLLEYGDRLDSKYRDHQLKGDLSGLRECHIKDDVLLLYQICDDVLVLVLIDIGSHSYLFE